MLRAVPIMPFTSKGGHGAPPARVGRARAGHGPFLSRARQHAPHDFAEIAVYARASAAKAESFVPSPLLQREPDAGAPQPTTPKSAASYGPSCDKAQHIDPYIAPGHDAAKKILARIIGETTKSPRSPTVDRLLQQYFGRNAATGAAPTVIAENLKAIQRTIDTPYTYHCSSSGKSVKDALPCKGESAETEPSGNRDITLCFDRIAHRQNAFSATGVAHLIIHENFHRAFGRSEHVWRPEGPSGCFTNTLFLAQSSLVVDNPDSYACYALALNGAIGKP